MRDKSHRPIRVLLVEDSQHDADLVLRELRKGGWEARWRRVETAEDFEAALRSEAWDIVLCDYRMPRFSAPEALGILRRVTRNTPFIVISGVVSEEAVVDLLRSGAHDFMTKDRLARLVPAVQRELEDAALRAERKRIREQLLVSERMATLGLLAAGVGHEINNPLAALVLDIDLAAQKLGEALDRGRAADTPEIREASRLLDEAQEASSRVQQIVRDLHVFARSSPEDTERVDVVEVIESVLRLAANEIRHHAEVQRCYGDVPPLYVNKHRLGQVILNLVINAAQAMPEGRADRNELAIRTGFGGDGRVFVEVADTGVGIAAEDMPRLFEPLFSTKPSGTGLGLSICKRIVDDMGGEITVRSELGSGSTFRVTLPASAVEFRAAPEEPGAEVPGGPSRRILIVDDDALVAGAMQALLSAHHDTTVVNDARDALALIERGEHYDVVFCDLMMPQMNGIDLYNEVLQRTPELARRIVFMTGGAFTPAAAAFLDRVENPHVQKPFDVETLEAAAQAAAST
jgi:signal transduction histidine kinase